MPPQRRKYLDGGEDENKPTSKRVKNNMHSSFYSRRSSKPSNEYSDSGSFSQKKCIAWFNEYASTEDPDVIGPEGVEKLCKDLNVEPENIVMLVIAWKMDAKQMGYFTLKEWLKGLSELQCDSIVKLRSKLDYLRSLLNDPTTFKSIYRYSFDFAKSTLKVLLNYLNNGALCDIPRLILKTFDSVQKLTQDLLFLNVIQSLCSEVKDKDQRSMDVDTAKAMLQLLLGKQWTMIIYFIQFLDQSKYKVINKDQWCNVLEFSRSISPDLRNYDEDGAWPVLLDEFVDWYRKSILGEAINL